MKKILTVFIISIIYQLFPLNVSAGSDGALEIKNQTKEQSTDVKDCFETVNRGIFAFNQGLDKIFSICIFSPIELKLPQRFGKT